MSWAERSWRCRVPPGSRDGLALGLPGFSGLLPTIPAGNLDFLVPLPQCFLVGSSLLRVFFQHSFPVFRTLVPESARRQGGAGWSRPQQEFHPRRSGSHPRDALSSDADGVQTLELWQINPQRWLSCYLQSCAESGNRAPPQLRRFLPWEMDPAQRAAWGRPSGREAA